MINSRYDGILHKETSPRMMEGFFVLYGILQKLL